MYTSIYPGLRHVFIIQSQLLLLFDYWALWLDSILTYNPFTSFPWEFLRNCITLCSKRSGHLHDSGIDLVKVEIDPKLNADAGMEWPHSSISRAFKSPPCDSSATVCERKLPRWKRTGNIYDTSIGDFITNFAENSEILIQGRHTPPNCRIFGRHPYGRCSARHRSYGAGQIT